MTLHWLFKSVIEASGRVLPNHLAGKSTLRPMPIGYATSLLAYFIFTYLENLLFESTTCNGPFRLSRRRQDHRLKPLLRLSSQLQSWENSGMSNFFKLGYRKWAKKISMHYLMSGTTHCKLATQKMWRLFTKLPRSYYPLYLTRCATITMKLKITLCIFSRKARKGKLMRPIFGSLKKLPLTRASIRSLLATIHPYKQGSPSSIVGMGSGGWLSSIIHQCYPSKHNPTRPIFAT